MKLIILLPLFIISATATQSTVLGEDTKCGDQDLDASCCDPDSKLCQFLSTLDPCASNHVYCCDFSNNSGIFIPVASCFAANIDL
ncbi:hypothetical protein ASPCADRAFT_6376 [Aspergillus carbonarius ITEM 5010]|uniref:Hydrophobin n=1 Tax=Aspergillus carbonarius (strain ITEM 5010) TaxID=602072 RepID=A0A1R3RJP7_ASPC5|nr:hypothetical protein ASPCADRAFT_6376 [Aspergillus carbonarius ITEM 5010]